MSLDRRSAGVLLHLTSLPGPLGSGDLGPPAFEYVDELARGGAGWWQVLPVLPPNALGSPYMPASTFAASPRLVSPERLVEDGLLDAADVERARLPETSEVDFAASSRARERLLRRAHEAFLAGRGAPELRDDLARRAQEREQWLADWCLFAALRRAHAGRGWPAWDEGLRRRTPARLRAARAEHAAQIAFQAFVQDLFGRQWTALREHARARGVRLLGDLPMFVAPDGADTWCAPELWALDGAGRMERQVGAPPDAFNAAGQRWGMPPYRWSAHRAEDFAWWRRRIARQLALYDALRIDHFVGLVHAWTMPVDARSARRGHREPGPGAELLRAAGVDREPLRFVTEDLGDVTDEVVRAREELDLPCMRVLEFAFGEPVGTNPHLPHEHPHECVAFSGTHDCDTLRGWFAALPRGSARRGAPAPDTRAYVLALAGGTPRDAPRSLLRYLFGSPARTAIVQAQDLAWLGAEARMNRPGIGPGNWRWRAQRGDLFGRPAELLHELARLTGRLVGPRPVSSPPAPRRGTRTRPPR